MTGFEKPYTFIVSFKHGSVYGKTYVEAHTKEQAGEIARIQQQCGHNSRSKFVVIKVLMQGEHDPDDDEAMKYLVKKA